MFVVRDTRRVVVIFRQVLVKTVLFWTCHFVGVLHLNLHTDINQIIRKCLGQRELE